MIAGNTNGSMPRYSTSPSTPLPSLLCRSSGSDGVMGSEGDVPTASRPMAAAAPHPGTPIEATVNNGRCLIYRKFNSAP